jgi:hypothetical protein
MASYYKHHIFLCVNERATARPAARSTTRRPPSTTCKARREGLRPGRTGRRARQQGRLPGPLRGGPVAVVYPEEVWYTFVDQADIDEIVDSHLKRRRGGRTPAAAAHVGR